MARRSTPVILIVNPDGTITYDFKGHVHAVGLDLDAATVVTPPTEDRIQWSREDGSLVAYIAGADTSGQPPGTRDGQLWLRAKGERMSYAEIGTEVGLPLLARLFAQTGFGLSRVVIDADGQRRLLLNSAGESDLVKAENTSVGDNSITLRWDGANVLIFVAGVLVRTL